MIEKIFELILIAYQYRGYDKGARGHLYEITPYESADYNECKKDKTINEKI